jgi:myo-inositol-1(or 4)-monophosphatase
MGTTTDLYVDVRMPMLCVSIGLCIERQPVAGAIYNPLTDELFSAALGHGATLDGNSISVSKLSKSLKTSLIITEFTTKEEAEYTAGDAVKLMQRVQSVRMHGSAALDLCYTACGRADGYVQRGIKCWDICAGIVIVREAGGFVTDYKGKEHFDLCNGHIIATSCPAVTHEIIGVLQ